MERKRIKAVAVKLAEQDGLINLSRLGLCEAADISDGSFPHVMGCSFLEFVDELRGMRLSIPHATVIKSRTHPALRKEHILNTAVALSEDIGFESITRDAVAELAGISGGLVSQYFNMMNLKNAVMKQAVDLEVLDVVAQGIVVKHPLIKYISETLRRKVIKHLNRVNK